MTRVGFIADNIPEAAATDAAAVNAGTEDNENKPEDGGKAEIKKLPAKNKAKAKPAATKEPENDSDA